MIPIYVKEPRERVESGLVDGRHIHLHCSSCRKPLADLWVTRPDAEKPGGGTFQWKVRALCCYCGDSSFPAEFTGMYHLGSPARRNPNNPEEPEDEILTTSVIDLTTAEDGTILLHTAPVPKG